MKIATYILFFLFISCKSLSVSQDIFGVYYKKGKDFEYTLVLNNNNTFNLTIKYQDAKPQCTGKWEFIESKMILLKCNEVESISETLTNSYMTVREKKVKVINNNTLLLDQIKLKRGKKIKTGTKKKKP